MPVTFTKSDMTAARCPTCGSYPLVEDVAKERGRTVTYRCPKGHIIQSASDDRLARRAWTSEVRKMEAIKRRTPTNVRAGKGM